MMAQWSLVAVWLLASLASRAAAALPPQSNVEILGSEAVLDAFAEKDGLAVAQAQVKVTVPVPSHAEVVWVKARAGSEKAEWVATFSWSDGSSTPISVRAGSDGVTQDGCLQLPWGVKLHTRPDLQFYLPERRKAAIRDWEASPAASRHLVKIELRRRPMAAQVWVDGRFVKDLPPRPAFKELVLMLPRGSAIQEVQWGKAAPAPYLPLCIEAMSRPGSMADAEATIGSGDTVLNGIPFSMPKAGGNIQVAGLGRLRCPSDDLVSFYWRRSTLSGLPESCILSVPLDTYAYAHILCAAEDDPAKAEAFTLRLTRYANSRGDAMADTLVRLPAGAKPVGTVAYGPPNARKAAPLWLVRVPLKAGRIQDLLREDETKYGFAYPLPTSRYLDLELMDPLEGVEESDGFPPPMGIVRRTYAPLAQQSAVHVFGLTLEASPAEMVVRANVPIHAFYASDRPEWRAEVRARQAGKHEVAWDFADVSGAVIASGRKELTLAAEGQGETVAVPVTVGNGWYAARFVLRDASGRELVDHRASFVVLPPDIRKVGFESPHGTWWFHWAHGGAPDIERVGPLLQRAGLRHTILPDRLPEAKTAPYQVTAWCVPWRAPKAGPVDEWVAESEKHIRSFLGKWPSCLKTVMLYHESDAYNALFPSELWGEKPPPLAPKDDQAWTHRMEYVRAWVKMVREKFPGLKIQIGNCGDGCAMVGELLRRGLRSEDFDYVAVEDLGQTFIPEKPVSGAMQSAWLLRQTARVLGHPQAQITGCYEWVGRRNAALGLRTQAEWYARDALQARALGFHSIALGTIHDAGQGYFHTIWGSGGLCYRYPYMYPKPAYAALATLTRVLDGAVFERVVPTGSLSLYALEFRRDGGWVYALWMPRGCREAKLVFAADAGAMVTDLYGVETVRRGRELAITVSTAAHYITTPTRLAGVALGPPRFPDDEPPRTLAAVDRMDDPDAWSIGELKWLENRKGSRLPHRTKGHFEFRGVDDQEKGKCLEIELKPEGEAWELLHEHVYLKLRTPLATEGPCSHVGVWVKGNSGWGEVMLEVQGADGGGKLLTPDWAGTVAINFDGWCFLRVKLPEGANWRGPVKVMGLVVSMPRKALCVTEMAVVPDLRVRLKDLCCY